MRALNFLILLACCFSLAQGQSFEFSRRYRTQTIEAALERMAVDRQAIERLQSLKKVIYSGWKADKENIAGARNRGFALRRNMKMKGSFWGELFGYWERWIEPLF